MKNYFNRKLINKNTISINRNLKRSGTPFAFKRRVIFFFSTNHSLFLNVC